MSQATEQALQQRIAARIAQRTPYEPRPAPKFDPMLRQVRFGAGPVTFPTRRRGPAMLRFIAASDFLTGCTLGALGVLLVVAGVAMLAWRLA